MMTLSRRRFLGVAASVPLVLPQRLTADGTIPRIDPATPRCLLVDTGKRCILQESLTGFARGLAAASIPFEQVPAPSARPAHLVVIPGAVMDSPALASAIRRLTDSGNTILYESAAAFAEREAFETERRLLRDYFGLSLQAPQELWPVKREVGGAPYVHYHWPARVIVRDFSRVVAVSSEAVSSAHIAHIGTAAVACYRQLGKGAFVFLGSPLGPHIGFGDAEARRLLLRITEYSDNQYCSGGLRPGLSKLGLRSLPIWTADTNSTAWR